MANFSYYTTDNCLNAALRGTAFPLPTNVYLALFTTAIASPAGTGGVECAGGSYARQPCTLANFGIASNGSTSNGSVITMTTATSPGWGTAVGWGLYDAVTAGNLLLYGNLVGTNDVQTISTSAQLTAGTYMLNPNGQTTIAINYNDTAAQILEKLELAAGAGNFTVSFSGNRFDQASPGTLVITFTGGLQWASQTLMTITPTGITGGTLSIAHTTAGSSGDITVSTGATVSVAIGNFTVQMQ